MLQQTHRPTVSSIFSTSKVLLPLKGQAQFAGEPVWRFNFVMQNQLQTQWCWAAVSASVSRFYDGGSSWTQCSLANQQLAQATCCQDGSTSGCNQPWYLDRGLQAVGRYDSISGGLTSRSTFKNVIPQNRPIGLRIQWPNGTGHFIIVHGYMEYFDGDMGFNIKDPYYGDSYLFYDALRTNYQNTGAVTHTYYTKR